MFPENSPFAFEYRKGKFGFSFMKHAGVLSAWNNSFTVHLLVLPRFWVWGYERDDTFISLKDVGLGPLIRIGWESD